MAEDKDISISVIIPTNNSSELTRHYLPQLCAHIEECDNIISSYEIVVSDSNPNNGELIGETDSGQPNVRLIYAKPGLSDVENLNNALFAATKEYVLMLGDNILPTYNYFNELISLFQYVPSLFGASGNTLVSTNTDYSTGLKTLDPTASGISIVEVPFKSKKPTYTLALSESNMLINRRLLCIMGGFCTLYKNIDAAKTDVCIRAWRAGRKCLFTAAANCKQFALQQPKEEDSHQRNIDKTFNNLVLNHLHTSRLLHLKFWGSFTANYIRTVFSGKEEQKDQKAANKQFLNRIKAIHTVRHWFKKQRNEPFDKIAKGYFSGPLQEISLSRQHENNNI